MSARYQLLPRGVRDTDAGLDIAPGQTGWAAYQDWVAAGGIAYPLPIAPRWPNLATARAEVKAAITQERDSREAAGFEYLGKTIDSDPRAAQRISLAVQAAQAALAAGRPFSVDWTCADNSILTLDAAGVIGMPVALAMHAMTLHEQARTAKALADAAAMADLEAFDPIGGW